MNELKLKCTDPKTLINFLTKFRHHDNSLLLEIIDSEIIVKSSTLSKSSVKVGTCNFNEVFETVKGTKLPSNLRIAFLNLDKLISFMKLMTSDDATIIIACQESTMNSDYCFANKFVINNKSSKVTIPCLEEDQATYITENTIEKLFTQQDPCFTLKYDKEFFDKLQTFAGLDSSKYIKINSIKSEKKDVVVFSGRYFNLKYEGEFEVFEESEMFLLKDNLRFLDKEDFDLYCKKYTVEKRQINTLLFFSNESTFKVCITTSPEDYDDF